MSRFRYRMQSILDLKYKTETQAKSEFGMANVELSRQEEALNSLILRRRFYFEEGKRLRESKSLSLTDIMQNDYFIICMDEAISEQKENVKKAEEAVEEKRVKLTVEMQERKIQEKLREKAFESYLADEKRAEALETDQRSSFIYGRR